jgi:small basic protein
VKRLKWNDAVIALTLVHLGQQLGTQTPLARAVFDLVTLLNSFFALQR